MTGFENSRCRQWWTAEGLLTAAVLCVAMTAWQPASAQAPEPAPPNEPTQSDDPAGTDAVEALPPAWSWYTTSYQAAGIETHEQCMIRLRATVGLFRARGNRFVPAHETGTTFHLAQVNGQDASALLICSPRTRVVVLVVQGDITAEEADSVRATLLETFRLGQ